MNSELERCIVQKMLARRVFGSRAVSEGDLMHWHWKPHERGLLKEAVKSLIKQEKVIVVNKSKRLITLDISRVT